MSLSPLPPASSVSTSPSGPRKRSIHEVDDAAVPALAPKRSMTDFSGENQENHDPSLSAVPSTKASPHSENTSSVLPPPPTVEIPIKPTVSNPPSETSPDPTANNGAAHVHSPQRSNQGSPVKSDMAGTPSKKQKLSPASKGAKQQEKEARERQRLEDKQMKEEEKHRKEEEKRLKADEKKKRDAEREEEKRLKEEDKKKREAEREEKRKAKEEERAAKEAAKEDEKRRKEDEKKKKERAQPKLNSFFMRPPVPSTLSTAGNSSSPSKAPPSGDTSATKAPSPESDYAKAFPDFFLQSHTVVAPPHRFERDAESLRHVRHILDEGMNPAHDTPFQPTPFRPSEIFHLIPYRRRRGRQAPSVGEILQRIQTAGDGALSGLNRESKTPEHPLNQLRQVRMKSLKFGEDVRPPYQGTFTRTVPEPAAIKLSRNPYHRGLPETNYDYDSEAEWEEPEEGEDLDSEEEEEGSDDGDDDMDGFLDDEDDALAGGKRRLIVGDLEPICSGLRWAADGTDKEFKQYGMETISESVKFPIDPFSTAYWQKPRAADHALAKSQPNRPQTLDGFRVPSGPDAPAVGGALPTTSKSKRPFPPELLTEFKEVVEGSELNKIGTVEILKKRFPKVSKDTLKATLDQVATRVGQKEADKKWILR